MPTLLFVLWILTILVLSVILHELAHAWAARAAGLRVAFCGAGFTTPIVLQFGRGETRYFLGRWPGNGLTLIGHDGLHAPRGPLIAAIFAGPFANLLVLAGALVADLFQLAPALVIRPVWIVSGFLALSLVPMEFGPKGKRLRTDGMLIWHFARGTDHLAYSPGTRLGLAEFLLSLSERVTSRLGQVLALLMSTQIYLRLGERDLAREHLDRAIQIQESAPPHQQMPRQADLLRRLLSSDLEDLQCDGVSRGEVQILQAQHFLEQQNPEAALPLLREILADSSALPNTRSRAEGMLLALEDPEDFPKRAKSLLRKRGAKQLALEDRIELLEALRHHWMQSDPESRELKRLTKQLNKQTELMASQFTDEAVRERFLKRVCGASAS